MPKLTIDGRESEVPEGTGVIEAARRLGIEVPHYCYHPGLSIAGQCRLCMVEIGNNPRPQIACNTQVVEGMVVRTETPKVLETRQAIMEFHLINHPLDCPVCDQAGECWLQIYYMKHGLYEPRMVDEKVHKPKAVPLGPHVILDAERCILCSRCVRFCDEITGTGELGIFQRGDHSEIGLFPGRELANPYSGNVVDICPVGALTDRDFRFAVRVWYLETAKSICPGCSRGCNIAVHSNLRRPHHDGGRRVARLKPRYHAEVNRWWICDAGRYGYKFVDDPSRVRFPTRGRGDAAAEVGWDEIVPLIAGQLRRYQPGEIGVLASPQMANEDLFLLRRLVDHLGLAHVDFRVPPSRPGDEDRILIKADKNPNRRGAELIGLGPRDGGLDARGMLRAARERRIKCLWVFHHDLLASAWPEGEIREALESLECLLFQGSNGNGVRLLAHYVLPSAAWVEREGTFTNFEGRVQRFWKAVEPLGAARADWEIVARIGEALGLSFMPDTGEDCFKALAATVPAFAGLSYRELRDTGRLVWDCAGRGPA
ncbi:MAG: molybdopterin-dependent oxidoreductase [Candidatus Rokubacteria bacterium]|nr:molybdopterin-dependent oxidoreductase [Candidatus Rokubacteria bacterium]